MARIPTYVRLFKYRSTSDNPDRPIPISELIEKYKSGSITYDLSYDVVFNNSPNKFRQSNLHCIPRTETSVIDINEVCVTPIKETASNELVSKVRYTTYTDEVPLTNIAYYTLTDGHTELVVFIPGQVDLDADTHRYIMLVLEDQDSNVIVYTDMRAEDNIDDTYMVSASNKVVRILLATGENESGYSIKIVGNIFRDSDLGSLELSTIFDHRLTTKVNATKTREIIDTNSFNTNKDWVKSNGVIIGQLTQELTGINY